MLAFDSEKSEVVLNLAMGRKEGINFLSIRVFRFVDDLNSDGRGFIFKQYREKRKGTSHLAKINFHVFSVYAYIVICITSVHMQRRDS